MTKSKNKAYTSPLRFIIISVLTFGMYSTYWSWRAWETVRRSKKQNYRISSSVRGYFGLISNFSLFPQLKELAEAKGYGSKIDVTLLAGLYLIVHWLDASMSFTTLCVGIIIEILTLLPMVDMYNYYTEKTEHKYVPEKQNWWLITILAIGFVVVAIVYSSPGYWD